MRKLWTAFKNWLDETRMGMNLLAIEKKHRDAGTSNWRGAARQEVFIRANYIERFRDEASAAFLKGVPLAKFKEDFVKKNLMAKVSILDTATTAHVRAIIRDMPADEAFHGTALLKHNREMQAWLKEMHALNTRLSGTSGKSDRLKRVLRAGA